MVIQLENIYNHFHKLKNSFLVYMNRYKIKLVVKNFTKIFSYKFKNIILIRRILVTSVLFWNHL